MFEHHGAGPNLSDRIGDAATVDIGCRTVHRLEKRRETPFGIEIGRRGDGNGAGAGWPKVGENVAEQIGGDHHVEEIGMAHEVRRENVDVELVGAYRWVLGADGGETFVPVGHRDRDTVRLGGRGQVLFRTLCRQIEGEAHDPVDADAGEDALLNHEFAFGTLEHAAADTRILAFGVLPNDQEVDVAGASACQR